MKHAYLLDRPASDSIPIRPVRAERFEAWRTGQTETVRRWLDSMRFEGKPGNWCVIPRDGGAIREVVCATGAKPTPWDWAALPAGLAEGTYHVEPSESGPKSGSGSGSESESGSGSDIESFTLEDARAAALGWALGCYRYRRFKSKDTNKLASLTWPENLSETDRALVSATAEATALVRDLINAPASALGPAELAAAAEALATAHYGEIRIVVGEELLREDYPAIHAVGRAAAPDRQPRLIDLRWGEADRPKVTLVGKGVCFDSGGLDLKPANSMKLMKKDMGGAANVLGLASMVMAARLDVRLRVLIPAVENGVSGSAMRPLDVVPTRKGTTIEIGNTDAEGRVILADALAEASSESPEVLVDFATLTGAARVALGAELPALFSNDDALAAGILDSAEAGSDPLWRMPLWIGYRKQIDGKVADITNSAETALGGAITAALFLQEFVGDGIPWAHIDLMAWNTTSRPGRPEGGEAMGMRAIYGYLAGRYGGQ
jgi:leucyl aminopeptidase